MRALSLLLALASAAAAEDLSHLDRAALRDTLIASGTNLRTHERHEVALDGCQMTTFWWRKQDDGSWLLWSSFQFEMAAAKLQEDKTNPGTYVKMALEGAQGLDDMALFFFEMRPGTHARYEKPYNRAAPRIPDATPSPRGDGTTHYYDRSVTFYMRHENPGIGDRARRFGAAYVEWVRRYCMLAG